MNGQAKSGQITAWLFSGFLMGIAALSMVLPQKGFSSSENRYLQKKPVFSWKTFMEGSYGTEYEAYLSDQFVWRDRWIGVKVQSERILGKADVNGVYFAKDGYLIERFDTEDIVNHMLPSNVDFLSGFINRQKANLGKDHVRVMAVPSASQILTDKLPLFAAPYDQDQVTGRISGQVGVDMIVPVSEALRSHQDEALYYRTDHHWTSLGAYYGYESWALSVGVEPWKKEDFQVRTVTDDFYGTLYSKVNTSYKPDTIELYNPIQKPVYRVFYDGEKEASDTLYNKDALDGKDKYAVYLDGNHGLTEIQNLSVPDSQKGKKFLIVKDSFAHSFAPFAVNHFETAYMVDLRFFNMKIDKFIEENQITDLLVLYQIPGFAKEKTVNKLR